MLLNKVVRSLEVLAATFEFVSDDSVDPVRRVLKTREGRVVGFRYKIRR